MPSLEAKMLAAIRAALDHHNGTCPMPARAVLLNPQTHEQFGWDELWGVPVVPDDRVAPQRFRIDCDGSAFGIEEELAQTADTGVPAERPLVVPVGPRTDEPTASAA
ncbi:MAG TPA: hypothetical protein VGN69_06300 [Solirubrobacteraceae bacterium]|jgi:hypothetical protein|nr:hypothetical protein [Solirubrobacteraceae bacterium]